MKKSIIIFSFTAYKKHFDQINITYSTDIKTHLILIVSITSLMEHSTNSNLFYNVYILIGPDFNTVARKRIESLSQKYTRLSIRTIVVNYSIPNLVNFKRTLASSYRLLTSVIFPDIKTLIHLDCDTFIFKDLDYFYNLNMTNLEFRGQLDFDQYNELTKYKCHNDHYINAGVILMNLDEMRKNHFIDRATNFSLKFGQVLN